MQPGSGGQICWVTRHSSHRFHKQTVLCGVFVKLTRWSKCHALLALAFVASWPLHTRAQIAAAPRQITLPIDNSRLSRLPGNTRPEANTRNDRGRVRDDLPIQHMQLLLKRPPASEAALRQYMDELHDRGSPNFHRWLSPSQFAQRYGLAQQDVAAVTAWLV